MFGATPDGVAARSLHPWRKLLPQLVEEQALDPFAHWSAGGAEGGPLTGGADQATEVAILPGQGTSVLGIVPLTPPEGRAVVHPTT